ncbi:MAG: ATP-binding protein [candidate division WOR-3 bacterium]|nr:ATP-binding protein [candidate division WOR-3 bacterium]
MGIKRPSKLFLQKLFKILDNFPELFYISDPDTYEIIYMNKKLKELIKKYNIFYDKKNNLCYKIFQNLSSPCPFCSNKYLYENPDKPYIWIHKNLRNNRYYKCIDQFLKLKNGKYLRVEFAFDITNEINKNKIIKEYYKRYYDLFENVPAPIYITNVEGKFIRVNKAMSSLFGYTKEEFRNINALNLYHNPEDRKKFQKDIEEKGYVVDYEVKLKSKDGKIINSLLSASVIKDLFGKIVGYQGIIKNITLEKEYKEFLKETIKRKEEEIKKLAEEKDRESKKCANLLIYQSTFVHDFNNILGTLLNNYYLIKNYLKDNKFSEIYEILKKGEELIIKSKTFINSLLKLREEGIKVKKYVPLASLIERVINSFEKKNEIVANIIIPKDLTVYGYEKQLEILFFNLIKNSWEAKREEKIRIEITTELISEKDKNYVKISFTDNGQGIKKEELDKIFQPFYSTKNQTGIGLKIVSEIIKNHNGKIEVESEVDKYTTFHIYLPILKETPLPFKKKIILVGEGELIKTVKEILTLFDYDVFYAQNWEEALKIYYQFKEKKEAFLGFFYDSGREALEEDIKEFDRILNLEPDINIFYSSYFVEPKELITNNNIIILKKPYTTEELIRTISCVS